MFNNGYGIVNYLGVDLLHLYEQAPLWFDNPGSSFVLVVLFIIIFAVILLTRKRVNLNGNK